MLPFSIHLSTGSLRGCEISEIFRVARQAGFSGLELFLVYPDDPAKIDAKALCQLQAYYHMPIYSVHAPSYERYLGKYALHGVSFVGKVMQRTLQLAQEIGAKIVVIHPFPFLRKKQEKAAKFSNFLFGYQGNGLRWSVENLPQVHRSFRWEPHCLTRWEEFLSFCGAGIGMTLDTTHALSCHKDPLTLFDRCSAIVENIHLSDFCKGVQHLALGEGDWDYKTFIQALVRFQYKGVLTLEIYPGRSADSHSISTSMKRIKEAIALAQS